MVNQHVPVLAAVTLLHVPGCVRLTSAKTVLTPATGSLASQVPVVVDHCCWQLGSPVHCNFLPSLALVNLHYHIWVLSCQLSLRVLLLSTYLLLLSLAQPSGKQP
jgi:hypothetical protein